MRLIQLTYEGNRTDPTQDRRVFVHPRNISYMRPQYETGNREYTTIILFSGHVFDVAETCNQINRAIDNEIYNCASHIGECNRNR